MIRTMAGDVGSIFGVHQPIFSEHPCGRTQLGNFAAHREKPSSDAKFFVSCTNPMPGVFNMPQKITNAANRHGRSEYFS